MRYTVSLFLALASFVLASPGWAQSTQAFPDFSKQVFAGYQAWFTADNDGLRNFWSHWCWANQVPRPGNVSFELYPDVSEFTYDSDLSKSSLFPTELGVMPDGQPGMLYASAKEQVIDTHFKWLQQYGIDGVALTRFEIATQYEDSFVMLNTTIPRVRAAAEKYGRTFYSYYDTSGFDASLTSLDLVGWLEQDWETVMEGQLHVTDSPNYAREKGKPVIAIWGLDVPDKRTTPERALDLVRWFKNKGYFVMAGGRSDWRSLAESDPRWKAYYLELNMIQPWTIGTFVGPQDVPSVYKDLWLPDKKYLDAHGIGYQKVIWPGFAWSNWGDPPGQKHPNGIPRRGGDFMWAQAYYTRLLGASAFIAMFDEFDEGTAIAKAATDESMLPKIDRSKPSNEAPNQYFLTLDADGIKMSSDFYLRLAGEVIKEVRGEIPLMTHHNVPFFEAPSNPPDKRRGVGPGHRGLIKRNLGETGSVVGESFDISKEILKARTERLKNRFLTETPRPYR